VLVQVCGFFGCFKTIFVHSYYEGYDLSTKAWVRDEALFMLHYFIKANYVSIFVFYFVSPTSRKIKACKMYKLADNAFKYLYLVKVILGEGDSFLYR
jgi:hypothetical protein